MGAVYALDFPPSNPPYGGCPNCGFTAWCLPASLTSYDAQQFNRLIVHRRPIKRHEHVHRAGSPLTTLNVIKSGFLKTSLTDDGGHEQITGFSMAGELVGMDAISVSKHHCDTVALEDSHICGIAFSDFEQLTRDIPALQRHFHRVMGAEIARDHGIMLLLGTMHAEERVAMFLLNLSRRYAARGYSGTHFRLPMSRQDIGSYLGLKLETISRVFSRFKEMQLIAIIGKDIEVKDPARLHQTIRH